MTSPLNNQLKKINKLNKSCAKVLGDLKSRRVNILQMSGYLAELKDQVGKLRKQMVKSSHEVKKSASELKDSDTQVLNQELSSVELKIKRLGKILHRAEALHEDDAQQHFQEFNKEIRILQSKMDRIDAPKGTRNVEKELNQLKELDPEKYRDELIAVLHDSSLSPFMLTKVVVDHVFPLAYTTEFGADDMPIGHRGEQRFEEWLVHWISDPAHFKQYFFGIEKAGQCPPLIGPLSDLQDRMILSELRMGKYNPEVADQEAQEQVQSIAEYIDLKGRDPEFRRSSLAVEFTLYSIQTEDALNFTVREMLKLPAADNPSLMFWKDVLRAAVTLPDISLSPDLKFVGFILNCTAEDLRGSSFDFQLETFAGHTRFSKSLEKNIERLLPMYLIPRELRTTVARYQAQPGQNVYRHLNVELDQLRNTPHHEAILNRLGGILDSGLRTRLQVAVARFALKHAERLGVPAPMRARAESIISGKGFAAGPRA